jgi:hypothetical protein
MIHSVFGHTLLHRHGSSYAYISEWLSNKYSGGKIPVVPHIVHNITQDIDPNVFRKEHKIPPTATVFGGYGGSSSFDISFVKDEVVPAVLRARDDVYFVFMNFTSFVDHPRVIFIPGTTENRLKQSFVAACDAMLHARLIGETFGLACAEFAIQGKIIFAYRYSSDRHHILRSVCITYGGSAELIAQLANFQRLSKSLDLPANSYLEYTPEYVMERFDRYLIHGALASSKFCRTIEISTLPVRAKFAFGYDRFRLAVYVLFRKIRRFLNEHSTNNWSDTKHAM